ncbi:hypothetical protein DH2020_013273 [Rehmannia glutinosa]|uniref:Retrovirus-related Pol polyprotein from transposon TNT 1-94-like beta-barrel domain-containing protein n=1 Tax=Rehmannia glutinosa TaxID=99300 RepID=A0ABR0X559_REHGL
MANEKKCEVLGIGDICLKFESGYTYTLKNVRHVPDLCNNLISCAALENDELEGRFGNGVMKILKGSLVIFKVVKRNNFKGLEIRIKSGRFGSDVLSCLPFCDSCVLGKQHKVKFPVSPFPNQSVCTDILEYLHADVWGPSSEPTQGGNKYFLSIIDDFSRKVWVFLMKNK